MADPTVLGMDYRALLDANREMEDQLYERNQAELAQLAAQGKTQLESAMNIANNAYLNRGAGVGDQPTISPTNMSYTEYLKTKDNYNKLKARQSQASPYSVYLFKERGLDVSQPDAFSQMESETGRKMQDLALGAQRDRERKAGQKAFEDNQAAVKAKNQQGVHKQLVDELQREINQWWEEADNLVKRDNLFGSWAPPQWLVQKWNKAANALGMALPSWATGTQTYKSENPQVMRTPWDQYDPTKGTGFTQDANTFRQEYGVYGLPTHNDPSGASTRFQDYETEADRAAGNPRDWAPEFKGA